VRRLLAALLLICVGILIPASASPVRICLLEFGLSFSHAAAECCPDCSPGTELPDPCCVDLEELPDSGAPQLPVELPPAVVTEVPVAWCSALLIATRISPTSFPRSVPIRGPTSPAAYRSVLGIWRL